MSDILIKDDCFVVSPESPSYLYSAASPLLMAKDAQYMFTMGEETRIIPSSPVPVSVVNSTQVVSPTFGSGIEDAPYDFTPYLRYQGTWIEFNYTDFPPPADSYLYSRVEDLTGFQRTALGFGYDPNARFVTLDELLDLGVLVPNGGSGSYVPPGPTYQVVPPAPGPITVSADIYDIKLLWKSPETMYTNHGYTQIFRSAVDNFSTSVLLGEAYGANYYSDTAVAANTEYYYWIRHVSDIGVLGPFGTAQGSFGRLISDPGHLLDLLEEEIRSTHLHQSLLEPISLINAPDGILATQAALVDKIESETQARIAGLTAESLARTQAVLAEAAARGTDVTNITNIIETNEEATAEQFNILTAAVNSSFDTFKLYQFDSDAEGWSGNSTLINTQGKVRPDFSSSTYFTSPIINCVGSTYGIVRARIRRVGNPIWRGDLYYATTTSTSFTEGNKISAPAPYFYGNEAVINWVPSPFSDWDISIIQQIKVCLTDVTDASNFFEIDWIGIGREGPGASLAAIIEERLVTTNAIEAEAAARISLAAQMRGSYTGNDLEQVTAGLIFEQKTSTDNALNALSQQMSTLTAGTNSQFDHVVIWYFDSGVEGWLGNGTPTTPNPGWIRPVNHPSDPFLISPAGLSIDGTKYTQVRLRIRKVGNPVWAGWLRWIHTSDSTFNNTKLLAVEEPSYSDGIANVTFNVSSEHWSGKTITQLKVDLSDNQTNTDYYEVDWIAVGRPSPGASSAELLSLQQVMTSNNNALASDITDLNTEVANKASSSALNATNSRVTAAENSITAQSNEITSLKASVLNSPILPVDFTNGFSDWTFSIHGAPTTVATATGVLVSDVDMGASADFNFSIAGENVLTKGVVQILPGRVYEFKTRYKVIASDGNVTITSIVGCMPADYSASLATSYLITGSSVATDSSVKELVLRFSTVASPGVITLPAGIVYARFGTGLNSAETGLTLRVGHISVTDVTDALANAAATQLLDTRVTATEDIITAQSTALTKLQSSMGGNTIFENPTFAAWSGAYPDLWSAFGTGMTLSKHTGSYAYSGGNAVQFNPSSSQSSGLYQTLTAAKGVDAPIVNVEAVFAVTSGTSLSGAGILVRWVATDTTFVESVLKFSDLYPAGTFPLNKRLILNTQVDKPSVVGKTFSHNQTYFMANYSGSNLGALTAKTIILDALTITVSDANAAAVEALTTRVTNAEGNITTQSNKTTQLEAFQTRSENLEWVRNYSVNSSTTLPLLTATGGALPVSAGGTGNWSSFIATGVATGNTGYDTQTIARFAYVGSAWTVEQLSNKGQTGANPIFLISGDVPAVTITATGTYPIQVKMENERLSGGRDIANAKAITTLDASVTNHEGRITANANSVTALQNALGGATAGAFTTLKSQVEDSSTGLAATASKVDQVQTTMPGSGNLIPGDTEFNSSSGVFLTLEANINSNNISHAIDYGGTGWTPAGLHMYGGSITSAFGAVSSSQYFGFRYSSVPVEAGKRYCWSAYVASHRSTRNVYIQFLNASGAAISGGTFSSPASTGNNGGNTLASFVRMYVIGTAPANAVSARLIIRATGNGATDPYLWLCRPMFSEVADTVTTPPAYSPSGASTTIAAVRITAEAAANEAGEATARWEVKTTVGALTGGVGFYNDGTKTRFAIHANQFWVYSPGADSFGLIVEGNKVVMDGAFIKNGSIDSLKVGTLTVDTAIQFPATDDLLYSSTVPVALTPSVDAVLQTITTPNTTRSRLYLMYMTASGSGGTIRLIAATGNSLSGGTHMTIPAEWGGKSMSTDTNSWTGTTNPRVMDWTVVNTDDATYPAPAAWNSVIPGDSFLVVYNSSNVVVGYGAVKGKSYNGRATEGPVNRRHSLSISFEWFIRLDASALIAYFRIFPYSSAAYRIISEGTVAASEGKLVAFIGTLPRTSVSRQVFLTAAGSGTMNSNTLNIVGMR